MQPREVALLAKLGSETEQEIRRWLWDRLRGGIISSVARSSFDSSGQGPTGLTLVPRQAWAAWNYNDADFWKSGTLSYEYAPGAAGAYGGLIELTFLDVRFDPETIRSAPAFSDQLLTQPISPEDGIDDFTRSTVGKPPLSDSRLNRWADLFNEANPQANEALASNAIKSMFPDFHVARERLRRVLPERRAGRPRKNREE
jgi:hypothetical protein